MLRLDKSDSYTKSTPFTREGSQVQSLYRPPLNSAKNQSLVRPSGASLFGGIRQELADKGATRRCDSCEICADCSRHVPPPPGCQRRRRGARARQDGPSFEHPGRCIDADPFARYARDDQRDVPPVRRR